MTEKEKQALQLIASVLYDLKAGIHVTNDEMNKLLNIANGNYFKSLDQIG